MRSATGCCERRWRSTPATAGTARSNPRARSECRCGVERDAIELRGAEPRIYHTRGASGREKRCAFCGDCGTRLYHAGSDEREPLSVKAGSLDDTSGLTPTCHLWTRRAQPWTAPLLAEAVRFDGEPDGDETLRAQWRAAGRLSGAGGIPRDRTT